MRDEYDGLPPPEFEGPSPAQINVSQDADIAALDFEKCALYPAHAWWHLSHACLRLDAVVRKRSPQRLTAAQRDRLQNSILPARFAILRAGHATPILAAGFDAAVTLANHLAETDDERAARHPDVLRDALDYMRILRNVAHNQSLAEGILDRAKQRRAATVNSIIADALVHVPQFLPRKVA